MFPALQALLAPVLAPVLSAIEARFTLAATLVIRRAVFLIAATLFGVGTLLFLSVGIFFSLLPAIGAAGAAFIMALIWAILTGLCVLFARARPRVPPAVAPVAPPITAPYPAAAPPPPPHPAHPPYSAQPPYPPSSAAPPTGARPVAPGAPASRIGRLRRRINRAAPLLAIGALAAGIIAGRR